MAMTATLALRRCIQTIRSYRIYLVLAGVPYVLFLCLFHVQLQIYDQVKGQAARSSGDPVLHVVKYRATGEIHNNDSFRLRDLMVENLEPRQDVIATTRKTGNLLESRGSDFIKTYEVPGSDTNRGMKAEKSEQADTSRGNMQEKVRLPKHEDYRCGESQDIHGGEGMTDRNRFRYIGGGYIFSAFWDSRNSSASFVRIMAVLKSNYQPKLFCHFWLGGFGSNSGESTNTKSNTSEENFSSEPALMYEMCENHNKEYGGWILSCQVPSIYVKLKKTPCDIVISKSSIYHPKSLDNVRVPIFVNSLPQGGQQPQKDNFGICVPPLFGHIPSTTLVEFVELSRHLGADHVTFYVYQVTSAIEQVLQYYKDRGLVSVVPWEVPVREKQIWYHGQLVAINDCLYRSMGRFSHVVFNDVDEFLVPHRHATWWEMAKFLDTVKNVTGTTPITKTSTTKTTKTVAAQATSEAKLRCGYTFQSAFFDPLVNGNNKVLYDLESDLRTKTFSKVRSKILVQPQMVFELGIHHISRPFRPDFTYLDVDPSVAFIHHYRKCIMDFDSEMKCHIFTRDESLYSYIPALRHSVHKTLWELKELDRTAHQQQEEDVLVVAV